MESLYLMLCILFEVDPDPLIDSTNKTVVGYFDGSTIAYNSIKCHISYFLHWTYLLSVHFPRTLYSLKYFPSLYCSQNKKITTTTDWSSI